MKKIEAEGWDIMAGRGAPKIKEKYYLKRDGFKKFIREEYESLSRLESIA